MNNNKKIILRIAAFLVICLPLYMAIYQIRVITSDELTVESVTRVEIVDVSGTTFEYDATHYRLAFVSAVNGAAPVTQSPRNLDAENPKILTFYRGDRAIVYELFLSFNPAMCVLRDAYGNLRHIRTSDAEALLTLPIADALHPYNTVPTATIPQDGGRIAEILPTDDGVWWLRNLDGTFRETSIIGRTAETNEIRISQQRPFIMEFEVEPDMVVAEVLNLATRRLEFDGPIEHLQHFHFEERTDLQFTLRAIWREHDSVDFHGSAQYIIDVIYEVPAFFSVSSHEASHGDLVIVTAFNVDARDNITLIVPEIEYTASFAQFGERKIALLPLGMDFTGAVNVYAEKNGVREFVDLIIVNPINRQSANFGAQDAIVAQHLSADARRQLESAYSEIFAMNTVPPTQTRWSGAFVNPSPREGVRLAYGTNVTINTANAHVNYGIGLTANAGDIIRASNAGVVEYRGMLPHVGYLLVINHGAGLRTWYGRLDAINVDVGDRVETGQEVAAFGRTGMHTALGAYLHFAVSVGDVFINPSNVINNTIPAGWDIDDIGTDIDIDMETAPEISEMET